MEPQRRSLCAGTKRESVNEFESCNRRSVFPWTVSERGHVAARSPCCRADFGTLEPAAMAAVRLSYQFNNLLGTV